MYTPCSEKALKTLLAVKPGDSISGVARKIDENRETIRRAVNALEDEGYVEYDQGLTVVNTTIREAGLSFLAASAGIVPPTIQESYVLPHFAGLEFAYTSIDAVYIWTRGGYQVARDPDDYPLFIEINEADLPDWERFFNRFEIPVAQERQSANKLSQSVQFVLQPCASVEADTVDGRPVISLQETVEFAQEHYATFQSALDMLGRMYDEIEIATNYRRESA
jgi:hypothetical protein